MAAELEIRTGYAVLAELGETGFRSTNAAILGASLVAQGRIDEAAEAAADAFALSPADDPITLGIAHGVEAQIAVARADFAGAVASARESVAQLEDTDFAVELAEALFVSARVCDAAGESGEALAAAQRAFDLFERKGHLVGLARTRSMLDAFGAAV